MLVTEKNFKIIYDARSQKSGWYEQCTLKYLNGLKINGKGSKVFPMGKINSISGFKAAMAKTIQDAKKFIEENSFDEKS